MSQAPVLPPVPPDDPRFQPTWPLPPFDPSADRPPLPGPRRRFQDRVWVHVLLLVVTILTTMWAGLQHYAAFASDFGRQAVAITPALVLGAASYAGTILLILGCHEMGHYLACRYYDVDATLPYFIPAPIPLTGTLGAVIRIREAFPNRRALFDIGIAGPIAGFVVLIPMLFLGLAHSTIVRSPTEGVGLNFGEPLLFKAASYLVFGSIRDGWSLNMHPMVFAAWFGMLATAWNLLPFGQLDGGHVTYAVMDRLATPISVATVAGAVIMTFVSRSWLAMTLMMLAMLYFLGPRHPRVLDEYERLGTGRRLLAVFALVMFVLCFTPVPIEPWQLIGK